MRLLSSPSFWLSQIRPIDKKLEYQIMKLTKISVAPKENAFMDEKDSATPQAMDDRLKYRPNPDMLVSKSEVTAEVSQESSLVTFLFYLVMSKTQL